MKCCRKHDKKFQFFFDDYSTTVSETKHAPFYGKELKTLTPKQMLRRLLIALEQVNVGNIWKPTDKLTDMMWQIIYSLYQAREITRNYIEYK